MPEIVSSRETVYDLMMPFCNSGRGGSHVRDIMVELKVCATGLRGGEPGARKHKLPCYYMHVQHSLVNTYHLLAFGQK